MVRSLAWSAAKALYRFRAWITVPYKPKISTKRREEAVRDHLFGVNSQIVNYGPERLEGLRGTS